MIDQLTNVGVLFTTVQAYPIRPNHKGAAHQPWAHLPWTLPSVSLGSRKFPEGMPQDPSIAARMTADNVVAEPNEAAAPYNPTNQPK